MEILAAWKIFGLILVFWVARITFAQNTASSKELCFPGNIYNNNLTLTGSKGTLQNPKVNGSGIYPTEMSCDWLITVPEENVVKLIFVVFDLKSAGSPWGCQKQYVEILDGNNSSSKSRGQFCGYMFPGTTMRSSGRFMWVRFRSNKSLSHNAQVEATFTAEDKTICPYNSQVLTASASYNRTLTSPNYPMRYGNNVRCKWILKADSNLPSGDYIVRVTFSGGFELEGIYGVCYDKLKFYDGNSTVSTLIGSYCGTIRPDVVYSTGHDLYVEFVTNKWDTDKGFSFSFLAVKKEESSGICRSSTWSDKVHMINGSSGTFFTPNYPVPYPEKISCIWVISVPAGKRVKLTFEDFHLESDDYIIMRNGQLPNSTELPHYYGEDVYYSSGSFLWIKFNSTSRLIWASKPRRGLKARFEALDSPGNAKEFCFPGNIYNDNLKLTGLSGTLYSPRERHPSHTSCNWLITVPDGKIVRLSFRKFRLPGARGTPCSLDYVEVLDGKYNSSKSKGIFCGDDNPEDIRSSDRYMTVNFRSGRIRSFYDGFRATFIAEDIPTVAPTSKHRELCLPGNIYNRDLTLTGLKGTLQSPFEYYPPSLYCKWLITVPEGNLVELSFERFDLASRHWRCKKGDYVAIYNHDPRYDTPRYYCGDEVPKDRQSTSRFMWVVFRSDQLDTPHRGFKATFKAKSKPFKLSDWARSLLSIGGVIVFIALASCVFRMYIKQGKKQDGVARDPIPMEPNSTSASHPTHAQASDLPPPPPSV